MPMPSLARGLVPLFLMTCAVMELKLDLLTVQMMDLADQTTVMDMLMTLVWRVNHVRKNIFTTYTNVDLLSSQLVNWDNKNSQT